MLTSWLLAGMDTLTARAKARYILLDERNMVVEQYA